MLFASKNKSDVNLKGQRMQRFLRENINHAKNKTGVGFCRGSRVTYRGSRVEGGKKLKKLISYPTLNYKYIALIARFVSSVLCRLALVMYAFEVILLFL